MAELVFVNEKTGNRYRVVKFDQAAGKITLIGEHGIEFTEKYSKELFQKLGYKPQAA